MRRALSSGIAAVFLLAAALSAAEEPAEKAGEEAARKWLSLVDSENYAASWNQASELFKKAVTSEQWQSAVQKAREPFGRLVTRKLSSAEFRRALPGAPDGEYVVVQYETAFENKKSAVETVTPCKDKDGVWRVAGYYVK